MSMSVSISVSMCMSPGPKSCGMDAIVSTMLLCASSTFTYEFPCFVTGNSACGGAPGGPSLQWKISMPFGHGMS